MTVINQADAIRLGSLPVDRIYVGGVQVWPPDEPMPDPDISSLFAGGQQGGWYDPSTISTLFQDTAGTVPVTAEGQPVLRINDRSGRGNHLIANSGGTPGIYRLDGSRPYIELTGAGEPNGGYLVRGEPITLPASHEMVLAYDTMGENRGIWWSQVGDTNSWTNIFVDGATGSLSSSFGFIALRVDGVLRSVSNRDQTHDAIAGKHVSLWSTGTDGRTASFCFASYAGASAALTPSGRLYGMVWRIGFNAEETTLVESYMAAKAGL